MSYWGNNPHWTKLSSQDKAAAMALLEADLKGGKIDLDSARNALGAMINRAARDGVDIGEHVSGRIYQPTIEPAQFARLSKIVGSPEHAQMVQAYNDRITGKVGDWVQGATHFLAPEKTMLALEAQDPRKYRSWRKWTGFDDATGEYKGVISRDGSHAFLAPEGVYSAKFGDGTAPAQTPAPSTMVAAAPAPAPEAQKGLLDGITANANTVEPQGYLGSLSDAGDVQQTTAGLLGDILNPQRQQGQPEPQKQNPDPGTEGDSMEDAFKPPARRPIDMRRVAAVLQSRSRLGTA